MIKSKILLAVLLALVSSSAIGQNMYGSVGKPDNKQMTDAGSGLVHVDLYTGTGSVNVPIYDYSLDGLNLGVSFSYNAKGIKVDEIASSIGLGWSLNAGGSITRQVKGIEDEVTMPAKYNNTSPADYMEGCLVPNAKFNTYYSVGNANNLVDDQEHDIFYINLCGRMLKLQFYLDDEGDLHYITYPKSEIRLEYIINDLVAPSGDDVTYVVSQGYSPLSSDNPILSGIGISSHDKVLTFNIIDEKGNKFYFERGNYESKEFKLTNALLDPATDEGTYYPTQQWDLRKVETASGFTISYEYKGAYVINVLESITEVVDGDVGYGLTGTPPNVSVSTNPLTIKENKWSGYKTHLSKITYPNGVIVEFELEKSKTFDQYGDPSNISRCDCWGDFKLKSVKIESQSGSSLKNSFKYTLQHSYFNSDKYGISVGEIAHVNTCQPLGYSWSIPGHLDAQAVKGEHFQRGYRLKLNSIRRYGLDNATYKTYFEFEYDTQQLPYRCASQKDYFGYYNGNSTTPIVLENINNLNGNSSYPQYDYLYLSIPKYVYWGGSASIPLQAAYQYTQNGNLNPALPTDYGTDRSHNVSYMGACLLKTIKNGMGGQVEIQYKGNYTLTNPQYQYWWWKPNPPSPHTIDYAIDNQMENLTNDGLIVDKVIETDIYSPDHKRTTVYAYGGGQRFNKGGYCWYPKHAGQGGGSSNKMFTSFMVGSLEMYQGSNHGFSTVEKKHLGFNDEPLSKEIYEFTNLTLSSVPYTNMMKKTSDYHHTMPGELAVHRMGNLLKVTKYDFDNTNTNITYPVSEAAYEYEEIDETPDNGYSGNYKIGLMSMSHFQGPNLSSNSCDGNVWNTDGTVHEFYYPLDYSLTRLKKETSTLFSKDVNTVTCSLVTVTDYSYDFLHNIVSTTSTDSKGVTYKTGYSYNYDYPDWYAQLYNGNPDALDHIDELYNNNLQYLISNDYWKLDGSDYYSVGFNCSSPYTFTNSSGVKNVRFPATFSSKQSSTIHYDDMFPISGGVEYPSTLVDRGAAVGFADNFTTTDFGSNLVLTTYAKLYDNGQNPIEVWSNDKKHVVSYIWDTKLSKKLAEVANASYEDIAYTSFERGGDYTNLFVQDDNKGNWEFDKSDVLYHTNIPGQLAMTGRYAYLMETPGSMIAPSELTSKLLNEKEYLLSFWCKDVGTNSQLPQVALYNNATFQTGVTIDLQNTVGDWKLYTAVITADDDDYIKITAEEGDPGYYMDEIRLHPTDAVMMSYTYEPLLGISSTNNARNYITYTDYDVHGRYFRTRDLRGKIIEQLTEAYDDMDDYPNATQ